MDGHTEGNKERPCAIIHVSKPKDNGMRDVVLCPITHSPPREGESTVEIPPKMARNLRLDDERCWIKTHQINTVEWEKDRLPFGVAPAKKEQWVYGPLHHTIGKQAFKQVQENSNRKHLRNVRREAIQKLQNIRNNTGNSQARESNRPREENERSR
ncbi:MAG: type II toxin-antitoxin system PemK/MazF family toxin [Candidatus Thiodiazotropha sp. (ex Lucina pensylvanica)]|nr:type II toxin-antitoxin system PemK/MazF family toxin [Candidatus Thiodiazotropha sp. (ex Lucina pensylvanica)]